MKKLIPLLFVLSACATNSNSRSAADGAASEIASADKVENKKTLKNATATRRRISSSDEDFSWVEQLDFAKKKDEKYAADKDEFVFPILDEAAHALSHESLSAQPAANLEEILKSGNDPIVLMSVRCYQGKFDEAFKIADDQYSAYKNNTSYWNQLGNCYFLKLDYGKAVLFYNKSRDLDKKYVPPVNNLGVVYQRQGKFQKALAAFKLATDLNSFAVTPTYNLGYLYLRFGMVGKALPIFQGLRKRSPNDNDVSAALAAALLMRGDYQESLDIYSHLDKAILAKPAIGLNYAVVLKLLNRPVDAQTVFSNIEKGAVSIDEYAQKVEKFIRN